MARCKHEKALDGLTMNVCVAINFIEQMVDGRSLNMRQLALILNDLDMANDSAMHFALDMGWRKINNRKTGRRKNSGRASDKP